MATLFSFNLPDRASRAYEEVIRVFGAEISERRVQTFANGARGRSNIDLNGTPFIEIAIPDGHTVTTVVHELYHLLLRARGFPDLNPSGMPPAFRPILSGMRDSIQHSIFFDWMREDGLVPDEDIQADCNVAMADGGLLSTIQPIQRVAWYFSVKLENGNSSSLESVQR